MRAAYETSIEDVEAWHRHYMTLPAVARRLRGTGYIIAGCVSVPIVVVAAGAWGRFGAAVLLAVPLFLLVYAAASKFQRARFRTLDIPADTLFTSLREFLPAHVHCHVYRKD
jgi:hypothetical protein